MQKNCCLSYPQPLVVCIYHSYIINGVKALLINHKYMENICTEFGDTRTSEQRIGWYNAKQIAKGKINPTVKKFVWYVLLALLFVYGLLSVSNALTDSQIRSKQIYNLQKYHDINGFKPVH